MNFGKWLTFVVVALLIGAVIWGAWGGALNTESADQPDKPTPEASQPAISNSGEVAAELESDSRPAAATGEARSKVKRDRPAVEPDSRQVIMREASAAPNASERANALEQLADIDPVLAARKLLELAAFCAPQQLSALESSEKPPRLLEQRQNWCMGLDLSTENMKARLEELTQIDEDLEEEAARVERLARDPYLGRQYEMEEELANAAQEDRSDQFTEWVRQARSYDDINNLVTVNMLHAQRHGGRPLWRLGAETQSRLYPQAELLGAQRVALILSGCQRFGGCGPGQYMTMLICTMGGGQCAPGNSLQEHLYLTTTPVTYSLARVILARI
ncbi:MAG: hypothetical protein U5L08_01415 [Xanthomonadales bacterium]|nr:hypothetical protein [Xanthomonadales bacterium]